MNSKPKLTVIIPAYNEEFSIRNSIDQYKQFAEVPNCIRLIVVCNACSDRTSEIVRGYEYVELIETRTPGKANAINLGIEKSNGTNILIQDADTTIESDSIGNILKYIDSTEVGLSSPRATYINSKSWAVNKYYKFLLSTKSYQTGMTGTGAYLIGKKYCNDIFPIPNIIADDGYVKFKLVKAPFETIPNTTISVNPPQDLYSLIKIKTRSRLGNLQLKAFVNTNSTQHRNIPSSFVKSIIESKSLTATAVYLFVTLIARRRATMQFAANVFEWERDESARKK